MDKFIEVHGTDGARVLVNVKHIVCVMQSGKDADAAIWTTGDNNGSPLVLYTKDSYEGLKSELERLLL